MPDRKNQSNGFNEEIQQEWQREAVVTVGTDEEFDNLLQETTAAGMTMLVDFGAKWCGPCKAIAPLFTELAANFCAGPSGATTTLFVKVDIDECEDTAEEYEVSQLPTFLFLDKHAQKVEMLAAGNPESLREFVNRHCRAHSVSGGSGATGSDAAVVTHPAGAVGEKQEIQTPVLALSGQQVTRDGTTPGDQGEIEAESEAESAAGHEHQLTADEKAAIAAKLREAEELNDEVAMAEQRGQAPAIEPAEPTRSPAAAQTVPNQNGTSATDAVMGSLFGGVWSWMSGQDLLDE